jgi:hypothetical protein
VWQTDFQAYVPSPLAAGNRLFVVQDNRVARLYLRTLHHLYCIGK